MNSAPTRIYKDIRSISLNKIIKYFQKFHIYIYETLMLRHHIIAPIQVWYYILQNDTVL